MIYSAYIACHIKSIKKYSCGTQNLMGTNTSQGDFVLLANLLQNLIKNQNYRHEAKCLSLLTVLVLLRATTQNK